MMRSCASATSAPPAILGSKRNEMYSVTRIRKMISPSIAFFEIVLPHVGPTSCWLIWSAGTPATLASATRSWSASRLPPPGKPGLVTTGDGVEELDPVAEAVADGVGEAEAPAAPVPLAVTANHTPWTPWPFACPGLVSPEYVYRGWPPYVT